MSVIIKRVIWISRVSNRVDPMTNNPRGANWPGEDIGSQVRVVVIHPGIQNRDQNVGTARRDVPGLRCFDIRSWCATNLASVQKRPHCAELLIVGRLQSMQYVIGLGIQDIWISAVGSKCLYEAKSTRHF